MKALSRPSEAFIVRTQFALALLLAAGTFLLVYRWNVPDVRLYQDWASALLTGQIPYRDFLLEYPPLALVPALIPHLAWPVRGMHLAVYIGLFWIETAFLFVLLARVAAACARRLGMDPPTALIPLALAVVVMAPFDLSRLDAFPALLTALAFLAVLDGRPTLAGASLGLGVAAKLYPVILGPLFLAWAVQRGGRRWGAQLTVAAVAAALACVAPFVLLSPHGFLAFLDYQGLRGLQLESLPGAWMVLADRLGFGPPVTIGDDHRSYGIEAAHVADVLRVQPWAAAVVLIAVSVLGAVRILRSDEGDAATARVLTRAGALAVLGFVVTSRVLSPQYLIWLFPFVPFLRAAERRAFLACAALTVAEFPFAYDAIVERHLAAILLLNVRNLTLLALAIMLATGLAFRAEPRPPRAAGTPRAGVLPVGEGEPAA